MCETLGRRFGEVVDHLLVSREEEILAFYDFPQDHWRRIYSTNPLERLNKELKRRSAVVGTSPTGRR